MRAAIYLRISQDHTGEGLGVSRQLEDCNALAQSLDWEVLEIYQDNDVSATSGKPRPAYRRLLQAIIDGEIDAVVCWHADRLYRKMGDLEELLDIVRPRGTKVATVKAGNIDLSSDSGQMIAEILASVAGYEGRAKATRWKRSIRQRREAGLPPKMGGRLYGYTLADEIEPTEAAIIRQIAADIIEGVPLTRVLNDLNAKGVPTSRGNAWKRPTLIQLLRNGRLAGRSTLRGDTLGTGTWPAILPEETFESLQLALSRRGGATPHARVALLAGMATCGQCGANLVTGRRMKRGDGTAQRIYRCPRLPGIKSCGGVSADAEAVEAIVEKYAQERLKDERVRGRLRELGKAATGNLAELLDLEQRLTELEAELDAPGVPVSAILRAMDRTRERIEQLQSRVAAAPRTALTGEWPTDLARRARLVRLVVESVAINPGYAVKRAFDPERIKIQPR